MNVSDAITQRRAVKHYDTEHQLSDDEVNHIMSLAKLSPTAYNQQNYRFVLVQDHELRKQVRAAAWDQAQITDASLLIILCADLNAWKKDPARYWTNAPQPVQDFMISAIDNYYRDLEQIQRDEAMRTCGIAAQTLMLTAKDMGYDSCPMDGFDYGAVGEIINLPDDHIISMIVVVGKATQPAWERPTQIAIEEAVITDRF